MFGGYEVYVEYWYCGFVDCYGCCDVFEGDVGEQYVYVGGGVDGDVVVFDFIEVYWVVGVVVYEGWYVECYG